MKVLFNAKIYTLDAHQPTATALAIEGGQIRAVGSDDEILNAIPTQNLKSEDLAGRTVIPGLTDAHMHLETYALGLLKVDCETATRAECIARVIERARQTPQGEWILGHGWNQNDWSEGFGTAEMLDTAAPHHPTFLTAKSLHTAWTNSAVLRQAGITASTPDPIGGRLGRHPDGTPDGILFESAMELVRQVIPTPTVEQAAQAISTAQPNLWQMGITSLHDFDRKRCFAALQLLLERGELRLRILKSIPLEDLPHAVALGIRSGFGDDWLRIGGIKAFADGALGPHTAAMLQPYEDDPANLGILMLDAEELFEHGRLAVENGLSLAVHAIGDRANHAVLDGFEHLRSYETTLHTRQSIPGTRLRHRIEHVQIIHPADAGRLAALGIIASMQPIHATSDMLMADKYWGERASHSYAWRTQLNHGARLAFGSDAPVESPNPFWGLHAAVTRRRSDGSPGDDGWHPEQRLSVLEAMQGFTSGAAYAAGMEDCLGRLSPGYLADLLVLDVDPFTCEPQAIKDIQPSATMVGGEWVFGK